VLFLGQTPHYLLAIAINNGRGILIANGNYQNALSPDQSHHLYIDWRIFIHLPEIYSPQSRHSLTLIKALECPI
jgi:hypothetical protein